MNFSFKAIPLQRVTGQLIIGICEKCHQESATHVLL